MIKAVGIMLSMLGNLIRKLQFKVTIKFVALASMLQLHELLSGKQVDYPQEAIKIIDIVLRELAAQRYALLFTILFVH